MNLICINGSWYVYVAGPFGTREAAEQRLVELTPSIFQLTEQIRALGSIVTMFTPEEVEAVPEDQRSKIEDAMVEAGNREIEYLQ